MKKIARRALLGAAGVAGVGIVGVGGLAGRRMWLDREPVGPAMQDTQGRLLWSNWAGTAHAYPTTRAAPKTTDELVQILRTSSGPIRPVGAGHSFTALSATDGTLLSLDGMSGLIGHDKAKNQAVVWAGTRLATLGPALAAVGQAMDNLPDINKQSVGGAIGTATHGTGKGITAVHGSVVALQLATPSGELIDCDANTRPEIFNAVRVGLGAFGVVTQVTLQNQPLKRVLKRTRFMEVNTVLESWPELTRQHRNVEFFIVPFTGYAAVVTHDATDRPVKARQVDGDNDALLQLKQLRDGFEFAPHLRRAIAHDGFKSQPEEEYVDEGWKLLSNERAVRFKEMEYHVPLEAHVTALREVLEAIESHRNDVFFPIEARIIAADDAWLSPFYGRETGSIAVHAYYKDDHEFFFTMLEPILRRHGGRPHWGKMHSLKARDLAQLYPNWREASELRRSLDPEGKMLNGYLKGIFLNG